MSHRHREFVIDADDDLVEEGTLSGKELDNAVKEFRRLRSENPETWENEREERSL